MNFTDLYRYVNDELTGEHVPFDALSQRVIERHARVGSVELYPCILDENFSLGHIRLNLESISENGEALDEVQIRYSRGLSLEWMRFVCCKELMHVFDSSDAKVNTSERMLKLLKELESRPLFEDTSAMLRSEDNAEWMALLVLCPLRLRESYIDQYKATRDTVDIARLLRIPVDYVRPAMSEYYLVALERLTGEIVRKRRRRTAKTPSSK